jgi:hypothetical protein
VRLPDGTKLLSAHAQDFLAREIFFCRPRPIIYKRIQGTRIACLHKGSLKSPKMSCARSRGINGGGISNKPMRQRPSISRKDIPFAARVALLASRDQLAALHGSCRRSAMTCFENISVVIQQE